MKDTYFDENRGIRLREERRKADLTQAEACQLVGMSSKTAWIRYEKGQPFSLEIVDALQARGLDMMYVIFGIRRKIDETQPEHELLQLYSRINLDHREDFLKLARTYSATHPLVDSQK